MQTLLFFILLIHSSLQQMKYKNLLGIYGKKLSKEKSESEQQEIQNLIQTAEEIWASNKNRIIKYLLYHFRLVIGSDDELAIQRQFFNDLDWNKLTFNDIEDLHVYITELKIALLDLFQQESMESQSLFWSLVCVNFSKEKLKKTWNKSETTNKFFQFLIDFLQGDINVQSYLLRNYDSCYSQFWQQQAKPLFIELFDNFQKHIKIIRSLKTREGGEQAMKSLADDEDVEYNSLQAKVQDNIITMLDVMQKNNLFKPQKMGLLLKHIFKGKEAKSLVEKISETQFGKFVLQQKRKNRLWNNQKESFVRKYKLDSISKILRFVPKSSDPEEQQTLEKLKNTVYFEMYQEEQCGSWVGRIRTKYLKRASGDEEERKKIVQWADVFELICRRFKDFG